MFSLTQKSRKVGPRSGPSCREETANAVHHPEREEGFKNGIPMVEGAGFRVLLWGEVKAGFLAGGLSGGRSHRNPGKGGFHLASVYLGGQGIYSAKGRGGHPRSHIWLWDTWAYPLPSSFYPLKPSWSPMPCSTPGSGGAPGLCQSGDQRTVTSPETFISLIHASNKIALHFS